jgi:hypothetical protein
MLLLTACMTGAFTINIFMKILLANKFYYPCGGDYIMKEKIIIVISGGFLLK